MVNGPYQQDMLGGNCTARPKQQRHSKRVHHCTEDTNFGSPDFGAFDAKSELPFRVQTKRLNRASAAQVKHFRIDKDSTRAVASDVRLDAGIL